MPFQMQTAVDRWTDPDLPWPDDAEGRDYREREEKLVELYRPTPRQEQHRIWWGLAADFCYILIKAGAFLGAIYLAVLGLPMLVFLALVGGDLSLLFAQLGNLSAHYLAATHAAQASFAAEIKLVLFGLATLIAIWRLPRFLDEVGNELARKGETL